MRIGLAFWLLFLVLPAPLQAQRADSLVVGADVRVERQTGEPAVVTGRFRSRDTSSFVLAELAAPDNLRSIPMRNIRSVFLLESTRSSGNAFGRGAGIGALVGLGVSAILVGAAVITDAQNTCRDCWITATPVAAVL